MAARLLEAALGEEDGGEEGPPLVLVGAAVGLAALAGLGMLLYQRTTSKEPPAESPVLRRSSSLEAIAECSMKQRECGASMFLAATTWRCDWCNADDPRYDERHWRCWRRLWVHGSICDFDLCEHCARKSSTDAEKESHRAAPRTSELVDSHGVVPDCPKKRRARSSRRKRGGAKNEAQERFLDDPGLAPAGESVGNESSLPDERDVETGEPLRSRSPKTSWSSPTTKSTCASATPRDDARDECDLFRVLPRRLRRPDGATAPAREALHGKFVGLYFSAHGDASCGDFGARLGEAYGHLRARGLELVLVSADARAEDFEEQLRSTPFWAVAWDKAARVRRRFAAHHAPLLILLDQDGAMLTRDAVEFATADPEGRQFPWSSPDASRPPGTAAGGGPRVRRPRLKRSQTPAVR